MQVSASRPSGAKTASRALAAALLSLGLLGSACGSRGPGADPERAAKLYTQFACAQCHGGQGAGLSTAPGFAGLEQLWSREQLAEYLASPRAWIEKDERLAQLKQRYSLEMPAVGLPVEDRLLLADHVLELAAALSD